MKKNNVVSLLFILGILTLVGLSLLNRDKQETPNVSNNSSSLTRDGETFENQMGLKAQPDSFTIPLTIVEAPPVVRGTDGSSDPEREVPKEAQITLGEQREEIQIKNSDEKISIYERDIFIDYPAPMILNYFRFVGFKVTTPETKKKGSNSPKYRELLNLTAAAKSLSALNGSGKLSSDRNSLFMETKEGDPKEELDIFVLVEQNSNNSSLKEKIKISFELFFKCNKEMIKNNSVYRLELNIVSMYTAGTNNEININHEISATIPTKNFFVINCGE